VDYLLDTNFLIGLWREPATGPEARFLAAKPDAALGIPWIVKAEFLAGAVVAGHALPRVAAFLADYPVVWADEDILPQPTDSARATGLLSKLYSKVSACGRRIVGYAANSAANPPYI